MVVYLKSWIVAGMDHVHSLKSRGWSLGDPKAQVYIYLRQKNSYRITFCLDEILDEIFRICFLHDY